MQPRVLRFGLLKDGNVRVGVFPEGEELLVSRKRPDPAELPSAPCVVFDCSAFARPTPYIGLFLRRRAAPSYDPSVNGYSDNRQSPPEEKQNLRAGWRISNFSLLNVFSRHKR